MLAYFTETKYTYLQLWQQSVATQIISWPEIWKSFMVYLQLVPLKIRKRSRILRPGIPRPKKPEAWTKLCQDSQIYQTLSACCWRIKSNFRSRATIWEITYSDMCEPKQPANLVNWKDGRGCIQINQQSCYNRDILTTCQHLSEHWVIIWSCIKQTLVGSTLVKMLSTPNKAHHKQNMLCYTYY